MNRNGTTMGRALLVGLLAMLVLVPGLSAPATAIIGGDEVDDGEYPFHVAVLFEGSHWCGGSLIHPEWVLTAAHCIDDDDDDITTVSVGVGDIDKRSLDEIGALQLVLHPEFDQSGVDMALIQLVEPADTSDPDVAVVALNAGRPPAVESTVTAIGWGDMYAENDDGIFPDIAHDVDLEVLVCDGSILGEAAESGDSHVCATDSGKGICDGDSGGPLVQQVGQSWLLMGLSQGGPGICAEDGYYNLFQPVEPRLDWIESVTGLDLGAPTCGGRTVTIDLNRTPLATGTAGSDVILGTPDDDVIDGGPGNDWICGEAGDDERRQR